VSLPTAHRRVAELVQWGALERTADGRYSIGLRLWEVATLSVAVAAGRQSPAALIPLFRSTALGISRALAHASP
jgi:DNA-binding IclR family transcriptional regulator